MFSILAVLLLIYSAIAQFIDIGEVTLATILAPTVVLFVIPLITYFAAKRNYRTAARMNEVIEYNFTRDFLDVKGESFSSQLGWNKFYKITKTKNWLLVWQNNRSANIIPMRDVWESQLEELKEILQKNKVKNNL
ncbi:YcxB family protein [Flavisolibacter ginsenosidimutans]|uniref:YcxB family protein n=1 Tax=Flavisolibacter ginsenosidimutans TaxID=661481 RepID=A0A5B8UE31_9BACT|nr:YcxB family protein [Flavisolibacter ginsenosidimutans]QEC54927.1 YcxB family protein [Flavisolibacter ginsenosidimutans]